MTRINTIDPSLLPTPWLLAEYRELPRIINKVALSDFTLNPAKLPAHYLMGAGHVTFFYPRIAFLHERHKAIRAEMFRRFGSPQVIDTTEAAEHVRVWKPDFYQTWQPSTRDHTICMARLCERWKGSDVDWVIFADKVRLHHNLPQWSLNP